MLKGYYFTPALQAISSNVFERRTSTGSGLFSNFDGGFAQIFSQIASITVKKLRNTNFISSRHVKRENTSLSVDVRRSKTSLLKLPSGGSRPSDKGGGGRGGHPDPKIRASVWSKNKGSPPPGPLP